MFLQSGLLRMLVIPQEHTFRNSLNVYFALILLYFRSLHALAINIYVDFYTSAIQQGPEDREKETHQEGKKLLCAVLACCSKIVHGLLTHTDRALHKASCSAEGAVRDATGHCLFLLSLFPSSQSSQQLLFGFHLCLPACSHFSSDPSHTISLFYNIISHTCKSDLKVCSSGVKVSSFGSFMDSLRMKP